jgi:hypothetical protein
MRRRAERNVPSRLLRRRDASSLHFGTCSARSLGSLRTPERWMVHHNDQLVPLSAPYVAFLMGINRKLPDATENAWSATRDILGAAHCSARNRIQSSRNAPKLVPARSPIGRSPVPKGSRTVRSRYADVWLFEARETCQKPFGRRSEDIAAYLEGALRHNKPFHAASVPVKRRKQRVGDS